ncbi:MAG: hypothetical protein U0572_00820 [Phycisphaerales bacterium]
MIRQCSGAALVAAVLLASGSLAAPHTGIGQVNPPARAAVTRARDAFLAANPLTNFSMQDLGISRVYGRAFSNGPTPTDSADAFVQAHSQIFGIAPSNLSLIGPFPTGEHLLPLVYDALTNSYKFTLVAYTQQLNGIPVFRSDLRVLVRNEPGFPAVEVTSTVRDLGAAANTLAANIATLAPANAAKLQKAIAGQFRQPVAVSDVGTVIYAGVDDSVETPRLAYKFIAQTGDASQPDTYQRILYVVDAQNSRILYSEDLICHIDSAGSIKGSATQGFAADICAEEVLTGLPYASAVFGSSTYYADVDGNYVATNIPAGATSGVSTLGGKYFKVSDIQGPTSSQSLPLAGTMNFTHNASNVSALVRSQINSYIAANQIHDLVLAQNPSYPVISGQEGASAMQINVNLTSTCNAFYDGTINFYAAGGGCANTGFGTVVHHEYGHHVVQSGGSGQGAYGEGTGDCMGILTTDGPMTAVGFQNNCQVGIRTADNTCQYSASNCSSCGSEIHDCGNLLSGCVWDLRNNWAAIYPADYLTRLRSIVINAVPLHGGTSSIQADIVIDYLTLDDDNADINDGTPNYSSIADAFGQHGLQAPAIQPIKFVYPNGIPTSVQPNGTTVLQVNVEPVGAQPQPSTGKFFWRNGTSGTFSQIAMTETSANHYQVTIPATACLSTVQFYVQAQTAGGITVANPTGAPSSLNSAISASAVTTLFADDFETAVPGWQAGVAGDTATTGQWVRVDPIGTSAQPEDDHTASGTQCYITGQGTPGGGLGEADIDNGVTTLVSPTFSALGADTVFVSYWRWYSNDQGSTPNTDSMPVQISNNNGGSWVTLENVTENANAWVFKSFKVSDFVTPTATMKVRWQASDLGSGSLVEAGVDDFAVVGYNCTVANPADLNGDGNVDAADLAVLLGAWGTSGPGDLNGDGAVDAADLALLLGAWSA